MTQNPNNELLTTQPPGFSVDQAVAIAHKHFNLDASASPLWSERDQNFRLLTNSGDKYVLKIANARENPQVIDFQTRALEHIATVNPDLPVPRTIATRRDEKYCLLADEDGRNHIVRLISWLDGEIIEEAEVSPGLLTDIGRMLAQLGLALKGFSHPAANHHLIWDLKNAAGLTDLLPHIDDRELRQLLENTLNRFKDNVQPVMSRFRQQIIHADLNRGNVLISASEPLAVTGIIDFGDMVHTPLIMDLAIAAAYHLSDSGDPLGNSLYFIRGYHEVCPLEEIEAEHLFDLMLARICTSITVQMWRAKLYPENAEYLLIHNQQASNMLTHVYTADAEKVKNRILRECGFH